MSTPIHSLNFISSFKYWYTHHPNITYERGRENKKRVGLTSLFVSALNSWAPSSHTSYIKYCCWHKFGGKTDDSNEPDKYEIRKYFTLLIQIWLIICPKYRKYITIFYLQYPWSFMFHILITLVSHVKNVQLITISCPECFMFIMLITYSSSQHNVKKH